jgi:protein-tyrosine phosphatase
MQALVDYGLRTIIDLRWPEEVQAGSYEHLLDGHPLRRIHISLLDDDATTWRARGYHPEPKDQLNIFVLENTQPRIRRVLQAIAQAPVGTLLFHCHSGKDRTGLISTLLLALAGVEQEAMVRDYTLSEDRLREDYLADRSDLSPKEIHQRLSCPPTQVVNTLSYLHDHHGSTMDYLRHIGLAESDIRSLKQRLTHQGVK